MSRPSRPRIAVVGFTSCGGCQLALLNCEAELALLATIAEVVLFPMASSRPDDGGPLDVVLVEGSIARPEELDELLALRRRGRILATVGACAATGGVNRLGNARRPLLLRKVYGAAAARREFPPLPVGRLVTVDVAIPGCPPEGGEILAAVAALLRGGVPDQPAWPVCLECRAQENHCLLSEARRCCLGPLTRGGCGARCPSIGIGCEGCRGAVAEANRGEMHRQLHELGLGESEIRGRLQRFLEDDHGDA